MPDTIHVTLCSIVFTSHSAVLSHIANDACSRSDNSRQALELAAKNVVVSKRSRELERLLSESTAKHEGLVTRIQSDNRRDLKKINLTQRVSELSGPDANRQLIEVVSWA